MVSRPFLLVRLIGLAAISTAAIFACAQTKKPTGAAIINPAGAGAGGSTSGTGTGGGQMPLSCKDGIKDNTETDTDCGGTSCAGCADGKTCGRATDCASKRCDTGKCAAPSCSDLLLDGTETDVDCGGGSTKVPGIDPCPACVDGKKCVVAADCTSLRCMGGLCLAASCSDTVQDGTETDVDCGGDKCAPCPLTKKCTVAGDCESRNCNKLTGCEPATCNDMVQDGNETDVDCGGADSNGTGGGSASNPKCVPCAATKKCAKGSDCQSDVCMSNVCFSPTCNDKIQNEGETDVDCGGTCPKCTAGQKCILDGDCDSLACAKGLCIAATCTDGKQNGDETDIDCGGSCANKCPAGQKCLKGTDCNSVLCNGMTCVCPLDMTIVPVAGAGTYCIDTNEVTYTKYSVLWNANPLLPLPAECAFNKDFTPSDHWPSPGNIAERPVTNVNWCQAYAYCKYAGRHLCGKIGGGTNATVDFTDAKKSAWFDACSAQGANKYPYGATYVPLNCNGADWSPPLAEQKNWLLGWAPSPQAQLVTSMPGCIGGAPGLLNMSGNVAEWEDSCQGATGANDLCRVRGGSWKSDQTHLECVGDVENARGYTSDDIGFRCCL